MKQTLLEITQSILASMDSDEVNSINDTVESYDIALLLRDLYYDIAVELNLEAHETLFELCDSNDSAKPVLMTLPDNVSKMYWVKYDNIDTGETKSNYQPVELMEFDKFLIMQNSLRNLTTGVGEMTFCMNDEDFEIMYRTDQQPSVFTQVGNNTLIFNSVDQDVDTILTKEKTMCGGLVYPTFLLEDTFTPNLDVAQFPYYRNRGKMRAFAEKKQQENREAASEARNQKVLMQIRKHRIDEGPQIKRESARYGRK